MCTKIFYNYMEIKLNCVILGWETHHVKRDNDMENQMPIIWYDMMQILQVSLGCYNINI